MKSNRTQSQKMVNTMTNPNKTRDQKWVNYYLPLAESGDPKAQIAVGWEYYRGRIFEKDIDIAERWFRKAAESVDEIAIFQIMKMLHIERARRIDSVFSERQTWSLGAIYMIYGCDLVDKGQPSKGIEMLSLAAKKGNLYAKIRLEQLQASGFRKVANFPRRISMIFRWLKVKLNNPDDERAMT